MRVVMMWLLVAVFASCNVKPEPLVYGKDACHACKMTLVDNRFGAELVTKKGKIYKFDDINCLIGFYKSGYVLSADIHSIMATEYVGGSQLIDATTAFYLVSDEVHSPMGSNAAVFAQRVSANEQNHSRNGRVLDWNETLTAF